MSEPKQDWEKMFGAKGAKGTAMDVFYASAENRYRVDVFHGTEKLSEEFNAAHEPVFGVDIADEGQIREIGDRLAQQIEQKLKL